MAGVLPPWHDGCHGSPVWSAKCWLAGNGRRSAEGLAQGALPLDPGLRACGAQGHRGLAGWPGFYRRGTTGATARRSGQRNAGWPEMAAARRKASRKGHCPLTPDCVPAARRGVEDLQVGRVLPPWHDGCHGSPVWSAKCWLAGTDPQGAVIRNLNRRLWHCRAKSSFRLTAVG